MYRIVYHSIQEIYCGPSLYIYTYRRVYLAILDCDIYQDLNVCFTVSFVFANMLLYLSYMYPYIHIYIYIVVWNFFSIYWEELSTLAFIFQRCRYTTNQIYWNCCSCTCYYDVWFWIAPHFRWLSGCPGHAAGGWTPNARRCGALAELPNGRRALLL